MERDPKRARDHIEEIADTSMDDKAHSLRFPEIRHHYGRF